MDCVVKWDTPKLGQHRERIKFAWCPIECEDGQTRWLEKVRILEEYAHYHNGSEEGAIGWIVVKAYRAEVETVSRPH